MEEIPVSIWQGSFWIGDLEMKCHVLSDGQRIIEAECIEKFLSGDLGEKKATEAEIIDFAKWVKGNAGGM